MSTIRVSLLEMAPRLRDILADAIAQSDDLELVQWTDRPLPPADSLACNALVQQAEDLDDEALPAKLLRARIGARVLLVGDSGKEAEVFQLAFDRRRIRNLSVKQILDAIRSGIGPARAADEEAC